MHITKRQKMHATSFVLTYFCKFNSKHKKRWHRHKKGFKAAWEFGI